MKDNKLRVLELFGGINATSKALVNLEIPHISSNVEFDNKVLEVKNKLWNTNDLPIDIKDFKGNVGEFDLIVAGFSCQPFSNAGKKLGFEDPRGKLFKEALRIVDEVKPKFVIFENVKGILTEKHKWIIKEIEDTLKEWGYIVKTFLINGKHFVPQNRERVFILARRKDVNGTFRDIPLPKRTTILKDFLDTSFFEEYFITKEQLTNLKLDFNNLHKEDFEKIIKVGNVSKSGHRGLNVYSIKGIIPTFTENHSASIKIFFDLKDEYFVKKIPEGIYNLNDKGKTTIPFYNFRSENTVYNPEETEIGTITSTGAKSRQKVMVNEYTNFVVFPRSKDNKLINGSYNKAWKEDKIIGAPASSNIQKILINEKENYYLINKDGIDRQGERVFKEDKRIGSLVTSPPKVLISEKEYLIRQITENEAMKLMGWDNESINKLSGLSKNKIYFTAGNSMIVQVMEHILKILNIDEEIYITYPESIWEKLPGEI